MFTARFLNAKERKEFTQQLDDQYGCTFKTDLFVIETNKEKIYVVNRDAEVIDFSLQVDKVGLYIASRQPDGIRLSIEGSEIVGPIATKNVLEITPEQMKDWLRGKDIVLEGVEERSDLVIVKCGEFWLGGGKIRENSLLNFVPKNRRIQNED